MKFKIKVQNECSSWEEEYVENISEDEIDLFAADLIANYNRTLRPNEMQREYLGYTVIDKNYTKHEWEKVNLATLQNNIGYYDKYRCKICGVTGKRYGLGGEVLLDREYRAKKYKNCNWKQTKKEI